MLKLISHGPCSDLIEHSKEVSLASIEKWEKIATLCHDIGKACESWQKYAKAGFDKTLYHPKHAFFGGVLAFYLIDKKVEKIAAFHSIIAHHSQLGSQDYEEEAFKQILFDDTAKIFTENILKNVTNKPISQIWEDLRVIYKKKELRGVCNPIKKEINNLSPSEMLECIEKSRNLLGRLVLLDHKSAKKQQENLPIFDPILFHSYPKEIRTPKKFSTTSELDKIRKMLKEECLKLPITEEVYLIHSPTGTAKTEAMLRLAEKINKDHIVYAVPQTSIADQLALDYLDGQFDKDGKPLAQIWNYRRREKLNKKEEETNDQHFLSSKDIYASKYNLTTFNQVAMALLHPHREYCVRSNDLKNCTIILDEYHQMPIATLKALMEITNPAISNRNITWILGSATPPSFHKNLFGNRRTTSLPKNIEVEIRTSPYVANRRNYKKVENCNAEELAQQIEEDARLKKSSLHMINLIDKGTAHVAELLNIPASPWNREIKIAGTPVIWLDATISQAYRKEIIQRIKNYNPRENPCILLCTPIIRAGVDVDFQGGKIDWSSIASTLQTAGRIGRNNDSKRMVEVYKFITEGGKSTNEIIKEITKKGIQGANNTILNDELIKLERKIETQEEEFFSKWSGILEEELLQKELEKITINALNKAEIEIDKTLIQSNSDSALGLKAEDWHELSTLYQERDNQTTSIIIKEEPPFNNYDIEQWIEEKIKTNGVNLGDRMKKLLQNDGLQCTLLSGTEIWYPKNNII